MTFTRRQVFILIGFVIILTAIPVTLYLVRQTQIFKPRAAFISKLEFVDNSGNVITQTTSPNVKLRITKEVATPSATTSPSVSPVASPSATASPSGSLIQVPALDGGS